MTKKLIFEAGQKFYHLTLVRPGPIGRVAWYCRCDCGVEILVQDVKRVRSGNRQSCGCGGSPKPVYYAGQMFHRVQLIRPVVNDPESWVCLCYCGKEFIPVSLKRIRHGWTRSCGCGGTRSGSGRPSRPSVFHPAPSALEIRVEEILAEFGL